MLRRNFMALGSAGLALAALAYIGRWWALERRESAFIRENALDDPRFHYVPEPMQITPL